MSASFKSVGQDGYVLEGEVTVDTVPELWPKIAAVAGVGGDVRVSCAGVTQADSAAVACLIEWAREVRKVGGNLRVSDLPAVMRVIMDVSDLDGILGDESFSA